MSLQNLLKNTHLYQPIQLQPSFGYCCLWCVLQGYDTSTPTQESIIKLPALHGMALLLEKNAEIKGISFHKNLRYSLFFGKIICLQHIYKRSEVWGVYQQYLLKKETARLASHYVITFFSKGAKDTSCSLAIRVNEFNTLVFDPQSGLYTFMNHSLLKDWTEVFVDGCFENLTSQRQIYKIRIFKVY